ncbi:MAG: replication-relaxation family protein [bacterium]|nr:replication-relaxation family protein [bacterium]
MKILPPLTKKQKEILLLLYKFRFLNTTHIQIILNHKNPNRIQTWLKDLTDKEYIQRNYTRKNFGDSAKPALYYLAVKGRAFLKDQDTINADELQKIYKSKLRSQKFINHCLFVADIYLFFLKQKTESEEIHFFTKNTLATFDHFPDPLPDAYLAVKTNDNTKRYFIDLFDEYTPSFVIRRRIKKYLEYSENATWEAKINSPLPIILFILPSELAKKHIYWYSRSFLLKSYNDSLVFFLTTKEKIITMANDAWSKVE